MKYPMLKGVAFTALFITSIAHADLTGRVVRVIDGDTLQILSDGNLSRVRLVGIDAPESKQPYGQRSKQNLLKLVGQKKVLAKGKATDRYGRYLAVIYLDGVDVNASQVSAGLAWAYRYKGKAINPGYVELEEAAKYNKSGLWSDPHVVEPWKWRKEHR